MTSRAVSYCAILAYVVILYCDYTATQKQCDSFGALSTTGAVAMILLKLYRVRLALELIFLENDLYMLAALVALVVKLQASVKSLDQIDESLVGRLADNCIVEVLF